MKTPLLVSHFNMGEFNLDTEDGMILTWFAVGLVPTQSAPQMHYSKSAFANPLELRVHGEMHAGMGEGGVVSVEPGQKNTQRH